MSGYYSDDEFECETCDRVFYSQHAVSQHMNALDHWASQFECETCTRGFSSQHAVNQHMNALDHWAPEFECDTCDFSSSSESVVNQHMADEGHYEHYCTGCRRQFQNDNNLQMTGSCPRAPNVDRATLRDMIRRRDPKGVISNKLLEWHQDEDAQYEITNRAFNGSGWECYLCHREFVHSRALNQHINSPAHQQKAYHCPNGRCQKQFVILAALFHHLESETCSFMRFERVQRGSRASPYQDLFPKRPSVDQPSGSCCRERLTELRHIFLLLAGPGCTLDSRFARFSILPWRLMPKLPPSLTLSLTRFSSDEPPQIPHAPTDVSDPDPIAAHQ
ncbi:zinc finger protein [Penicillium riverlandense]|uniref:zinc finger protein n=1 Tax=Penicillium riverlandense TaxID=1903569 RepID=UPI002548FDA8|nr:zinc finger protein [Penicillium riverlandense]KAJ5811813.1 zinc finger protein [Penicillium riverlandense]